MSKTVTGKSIDDDIELVRTRDGWAWVDTDCTGPGTVVEEVEVIEYEVTTSTIDGVEHLQIAEGDDDDGWSKTASGRVFGSTLWHDLDEMR